MSVELPSQAGVTPRPLVRALARYEVESPPCEVDLSTNVSAFGVSPAALEAIRSAPAERIVAYPTAYSRALREAIAAYVGVDADEVIVGCGSDDVLDCAFRTFAGQGQRAAIIDPTFLMARIFAITNAVEPVRVPLAADGDVDADAVLAAEASIIYLCSPNNPTANLLSPGALDRIQGAATGLVLVDEAYAEYAGESRASRAPALGNVLVLRTFSKAFGLAGLRVGYGIGARTLIAELEKVRGPYKVTSLGERAALAALSEEGRAWMAESVRATIALRERFIAALRAAGRAPRPSAANFVLLPVGDAAQAARALAARGIAVRPFSRLSGIGDALRISIGPWPVLERVLASLESVP
jgi:histidinol-phosphate aminotransferase